MEIIKGFILLAIILSSSVLGIALANKYKYRVTDLKKMMATLNILKTKIEYTYEPLPKIFSDIADEFKCGIRRNF